MENSLIVYKSITVANRAKRILESENISAAVVLLPAHFNIKGCSYAVKIPRSDFRSALAVSKKNNLKIRDAFEDGGVSV